MLGFGQGWWWRCEGNGGCGYPVEGDLGTAMSPVQKIGRKPQAVENLAGSLR